MKKTELHNQGESQTPDDRDDMRPSRRAVLAGALGLSLTRNESPAQTPGNELTRLSLSEASRAVREKRVTPVDLTQACLARIERLNPRLNAFITLTADQALTRARELEAELQRGAWRGPLHGIPIALKDLIDTAGIKTTAASALYKDRVPGEDAEVVRRLDEAGAILLGKLNMDEFAFSFTSETSHFGPARNPWDLKRIPGGSSGGSAVTVAAELCYGALGSDTGGSIRQPAAFCGIVGLKPSYGLVSTRGVLPLAWSLDHLGPMCRTTTDCAILLSAIAGYDPKDSTSVDVAIPDYVSQLSQETSGLRIGFARAFFFEQLDPEIESIVNTAVKEIGRLCAAVREVKLPLTDDVPVLIAEAYVYHEPRLAKNADLYHPRIRFWLERGGEITMPQYVRGRRRMDAIRRQVKQVFEEVDVILTPTTPQMPILLDPNREPDLVLLRNAMPMNIYDLPTISVPCGFTRAGLPVGMQISAPRLSEPRILALAHAYEQATDWHKRRPREL